MDDTNANRKSQIANQAGTVATQPQPVQQPVTPVGGAKEAPRVIGEWVSASTPEVVLPAEVREAGVEIKPVAQPLSQSAQQAGIQHAKEATPITSVKQEQVGMQTPRTVLYQLKNMHKNVKDSFTWLVRLVIKEQDKKEKGMVL